jgi:hypothetical protein
MLSFVMVTAKRQIVRRFTRAGCNLMSILIGQCRRICWVKKPQASWIGCTQVQYYSVKDSRIKRIDGKE